MMLTPEHRAELRRALYYNGHPTFSVNRDTLKALLDAADERDRLAEQVERVLALHTPHSSYVNYCRADGEECPCPTRRAAEWIAKRRTALGLLSAYEGLREMAGDLTAAVAVGSLGIRGADITAAEDDARTSLPRALDALEAVLEFATAERDKISRTYVTQPDTAYAGYANAMDDVIRTIEASLRDQSVDANHQPCERRGEGR